ncbi:MAG: hypothetical protein IT236_17920 [Bacteroidia bacterium]|nr:hypothetical protein [Bacteroidia bacterium]
MFLLNNSLKFALFNMTVVKLRDRIDTSYSGYRKLVEFFNTCRDFTNQTIHIDFYHLDWIDANKSALLEAIMYKLNKENGLSFATDGSFLKEKFDVLFRNGFVKTGQKFEDDRMSTLPTGHFNCKDKNEFINYLEKHLMTHRGMPKLATKLRDKIIEDLIEVFCNSGHHANTQDPFFGGGQYYPRAGCLKFTMVDLGDGFLPRIHAATKGQIDTSVDAINWALKGNSSKLALENTSGGLGIKGMHKYCMENDGQLDIITGNGYWSTSQKNTIFEGGRVLDGSVLAGSTINLFFNSK